MGNNDIQYLPVTPAQVKAAQKQMTAFLRDGQISTEEMAEINRNPLLKAQLAQRMGFPAPVGPGFGRANGRQSGQPGQLTGGYEAPMPQFRGRVNPYGYGYDPIDNPPADLADMTDSYSDITGRAGADTRAAILASERARSAYAQQQQAQQLAQLTERLAQAERRMAELTQQNQALIQRLTSPQQPTGGPQLPTGGAQPPAAVTQPQPTGGAQPPARTNLSVPPEFSAQYFQIRDWYKSYLKRSENECDMDHEAILTWARYLKNHAPNNEPAKIEEVRLLIRNSSEGIRKNGNTRENPVPAPVGH
jgi:hypothetical protein